MDLLHNGKNEMYNMAVQFLLEKQSSNLNEYVPPVI